MSDESLVGTALIAVRFEVLGSLQAAIAEDVRAAEGELANFSSAVGRAATNAVAGAALGASALTTLVADEAGQVAGLAGQLQQEGVTAGEALGAGLEQGVGAAGKSVLASVAALAGGVAGVARATLGISSPSRVFATIGQDSVAGLVGGLRDGLPQAREAARMIANSLRTHSGVTPHGMAMGAPRRPSEARAIGGATRHGARDSAGKRRHAGRAAVHHGHHATQQQINITIDHVHADHEQQVEQLLHTIRTRLQGELR